MNPPSGDAGSSSSGNNEHSFHVAEEYNIKPLGDDSRAESSSFQTSSLADNSSSSLFSHHANSSGGNSLYATHPAGRGDWQDSRWYSQSDGPNPPQYITSSSAGYTSSMWPSQHNYHDSARSRSFNDVFHTSNLSRSADVFAPPSFVSSQSHPYPLSQGHPSGITMSTMHSSVLPQSSDSSLDYFAPGTLTGQTTTRDSRTPRTLPAPGSSSPSAQRPRRRSEIKRRSLSRSVTPPIKSRASTPQIIINNMPPSTGIFGYRQTSHINKLTCNGRLIVPDIHVRQHKSFDITMEESKFVGYRRNYFCLDASYTLTMKNEVSGEVEYPRGQLIVEGQSGDQHVVKAFALSITGIDNSTNAKVIELVQFSPKRDQGDKGRPSLYRVSPTFPDFATSLGQGPTAFALRNSAQGVDLPYQNAQDLPQNDPAVFDQKAITDPKAGDATTHTWERIQFKNATANNGRRRQNQQAFMVVVTLWADIRETRENGRAPYWYPVAKCHSDEVVIRGRSPNHYHPKGNMNPASVANINAATRVHLDAQSMAQPRLSLGSSHPHQSHYTTHHATNPIANFRTPAFSTAADHNQASFGHIRTQWTDPNAAYPSANNHNYTTQHTFDTNRGAAEGSPESWQEEGSPFSPASMPLDPLLEEIEAGGEGACANEGLSYPATRYPSPYSCPEISDSTPFSSLSSPGDISSPGSSAYATIAVGGGGSPGSEWSALDGMQLGDHKGSFLEVGHWAGEEVVGEEGLFEGELEVPSSVYPCADVEGGVF